MKAVRRRSPLPAWGVAVALVAGLLGGLATPAPAHAVLPDAQELLDMLEETAWANGGVPDWVWRGDTRSPEDVARDGFSPRGDNDNLADHVLDKVRPKDSVYVATGGDPDSVESFMKMGTVDAEGAAIPQGDFWVYQIAPNESFVNVQKSFKDRLFPDGTAGSFNEELARNLDSGNPDEWITKIVDENEWAARGGIRAASVKSSTKFTHSLDDFGDHAWTPEAPVETEGFEAPSTEPSGEAADIPARGSCYPVPSRRSDTCTPVIDDEDALSDLHEGRFDGDLEDIEFSTDIDRLLDDPDVFLMPAPETLDRLAEGGDFETLSSDVAESFANDLDRLRTVSSDSELLADVGKELGYGFEDVGEVVPFAGIAATGYAVSEDWDAGRWGDLAFDGIAEVIQVAMEADPGFTPFLEPVLLVDLFVQQVADYVWKLAHPAAAAEDWRKHVDNANKQLESVPAVLLDHWQKERDTALDHVFAEQIDQAMGESLAVRMRSDATVLKGMRTELVQELRLRASLSAARAAPADRIAIMGAAYDAEVKLAAATRDALQQRGEQYRAAFPKMATAGAEMVWNLDLTRMADKFLAEPKISGYIDDVTTQPWEAYYGVPWGDGTSWKELLEPSVDASREGLNQVVRDVEQSRTWTIDPIDVEEYVELFGDAFGEKVGDADAVLGPEENATQIGAHEPAVTDAQGRKLIPGTPALVTWDRSVVDNSSVDIPAGGSVRWTVDVPVGLTVGDLPPRSEDGSVTTEWTKSGQRVVVTSRATAGPGLVAGRHPYVIPVVVTDRLATGDRLTVRFDAGPNTRSLAPTASVAVRTAEAPPAIVVDPIDIQDVHHQVGGEIRVQFRTTRAVSRIDDVVLRLDLPDALAFAGQEVVRTVSAERRTGDGDWTAFDDGELTIDTMSGPTLTTRARAVEPALTGPGGLTWLPKLVAKEGQPVGVFEVRYRVTGSVDEEAVELAGSLLVRSGPDGLWPVGVTAVSTPSLHDGAEDRIVLGLMNIGGRTKPGLQATITAPTGLRFTRPSFDVVLLDGTSSQLPAQLNAQSTVLTIDRPDFAVDATTKVELGFAVRAVGSGTGTVRDGSFRVDGGAALPKGSTPLAFHWSNVSVTQAWHPTLAPGQRDGLRVLISNQGQAHRCGAEVAATAPTGTRFVSSAVALSQGGAAQWLEGTLSGDGRSIALESPSVCSTSSLEFTLQADPSSDREGLVADGRLVLRGSMTPERTTSLSYMAKRPSATSMFQSGTMPSIVNGETGSIAVAVANTGGATDTGSRFQVRAPDGAVFPESQLTRRLGAGPEETITGSLSDSGRTLTVDDAAFALPSGSSAVLTVRVRNAADDWADGVAHGSFAVLSGAALPAASVPVVFIRKLADGRRTVVTADDGLRGEARLRTTIEGDTWSTTVEQYRMTVPSDAAGRKKANVNLRMRASGMSDKVANSPDSMLQNGGWYPLGMRLEQRTNGSSSTLDGTVTFVFDMPSDPGPLCPIIIWQCLTPDPKLDAHYRVR